MVPTGEFETVLSSEVRRETYRHARHLCDTTAEYSTVQMRSCENVEIEKLAKPATIAGAARIASHAKDELR
jgi:hypothetical protein